MRLKSIKIHNMHNVTTAEYKFDRINYICGPNGSGKSTILQAIQLGLLGYIPGTNKTNSAIFEHCNSDNLSIEIILDNNGEEIVVVRNFVRSKSKIIDTVTVQPDIYSLEGLTSKIELAVLNFNGFLSLTANKQKENLMLALPSFTEKLDTAEFLTDDTTYRQRECSQIVDEICQNVPVITKIDDIKQINSYLKDMLSSLNSEEKRVTSTIQSLVFYDDYNGEKDVDVIQEQILNTLKLRDAVKTQELKLKNQDEKLKELEQYRNLEKLIEEDLGYKILLDRIVKTKHDLEQIQTCLDETVAKIAENKSNYAHNQKIIESKGICPFIEDNCDTIYAQLDIIESQNNKIVKESNLLNQELQFNKNQQRDLNISLESLKSKLQELETRYKNRDNLLRLIEDSFIDDTRVAETSEELSIKLQKLNEDLVKASANKKYNELLEVVQKQKLELIPQIDFVKSAIKRTGENGLQTKFMEKPFSELAKLMDDTLEKLRLTELGSAQFKVEEKANSFSFGLNRNETYIPFELLSSGEKCIYILAFMVSILKISKNPLMLFLIDDFFDHLDNDRFATVIDTIYNIDEEVQVIIAGVKKIQNSVIRKNVIELY